MLLLPSGLSLHPPSLSTVLLQLRKFGCEFPHASAASANPTGGGGSYANGSRLNTKKIPPALRKLCRNSGVLLKKPDTAAHTSACDCLDSSQPAARARDSNPTGTRGHSSHISELQSGDVWSGGSDSKNTDTDMKLYFTLYFIYSFRGNSHK